ncbi:MAG: pentapeptide repeat-containing protein [Alphaproteobacteria bacterium]|nr:pentapeptide repeat-containing protein [Alphaproteobacteria bacterium]MCB9795662.1 pentapeptide repeat-containing protein [Alphaproteobacteria bacterium]
MSAPREFVLELFRAERPEDPYGFRMGPQTYLLRHEGGVAEPVRMDWEDGWMRELSGLQASQVPLELRRRLGDRLQRLLAATRWREQQRALDTLGEGETLSLTLRAQAAELLILPWELMTLEGSGLHLGADSRVLLRYEWPGSASVADALPGRGHRSLLLGWSEAGGGVGWMAHVEAVEPLFKQGGALLEPLPDLSLNGLVERLDAARDAGAPHRVLQLLCHGEARRGQVALSWSDGHIDGPRLAERLAPYADTLRVVVLSACMGGRAGPPGSHLGAIAQHLHRAGFQAVVASRTPLSIAGSVVLSQALHAELLAGGSPEQAFLAARRALHASEPQGFDWAALQLFARPADATEGVSAFAALGTLADADAPARLMDEGLAGLGRLPDVLASPDPELARRHAALVTAAFLRALLAAQPDPRAPGVQDAVDALLRRAGLELVRERGERDHASESERLRALTGSPLRTPYYEALRTALLHPDQAQDWVVEDDAERDRRFLLAWGQLMSSEVGDAVRKHLAGLEGERRGLVRRLVVSELSSWSERHVFGERAAAALAPSQAAIPLGELFVQPELVAWGRDSAQPVPALDKLDASLGEGSRERVVLVRGPFGSGKTLTARSLVALLAQRYLGERPGPRWLPVYVDCATDLDPRGMGAEPGWAFMDRARRRAWRRQLSRLVSDLRLQSPVLELPRGEERQVFVLDGLDEWSMDPAQVDALLRVLLDEASDGLRFVLLSRMALPLEARTLEHLSVFDLQPFDAGKDSRLTDWLGRWGRLTGVKAPSRTTLRRERLLPVASRPGLLVMLADPKQGLSKDPILLNERFLRQLARGKLDLDGGHAHQRLHAASGALLERLRANDELGHIHDRGEAMLLLMSHVAWEQNRCERLGKGLTLLRVRELLREEVGFHDPDEIELVVGGLLLALQSTPAMEREGLLFGHAPFHHHLVARYWAHRLRELMYAGPERFAERSRSLLGGRLMADDGAAWSVLMEIVSGDHASEEAGPLFSWTRRDRRALAVLAESIFEDEAMVTQGRFRDDRRAYLREAALAIRCSLEGVPPFMLDEDALRSLLAWFWVRQEASMVVARRCDLSEFRLKGVPMAGADLRDTVCREAELSMADLSFAHLEGADLQGAKLGGAELVGAQLSGARMQGANLEQANLSTATLDGADLREVEATTCELEGAVLPGADLRGAVLIRCNLSQAVLTGADLRGARLEDSHLVGADLSEADLRGADLRRVDLTEALLDDAQLEGAIYAPETAWPEGFDPAAAGALPA